MVFWAPKTAPLSPPQSVQIETTKICNSRCKTCMLWAGKEDRTKLLSVARRVEIVEEFAAMNPRGRVFICGGEPLLQPERLFSLTQRCNALGLGSQLATNGSLIDEAMARRLILNGPSLIVLSLNSLHADMHDYTRGRPGSFDEVTGAIRLLRDARRRHGRDTRIHVNTIVCQRNYRDLEAFHHFVLCELAADRLDMGFLQPTFNRPAAVKQDHFFADNVVADEEDLARILLRCDERFALGLNPAWIEQVKMYHRSIREKGEALNGWSGRRRTQEHICNSYERNIMVDPQGVARLCFSRSFRGMMLKRRGDLARFWRGAGDIRRKMKKCRAYCGVGDAVSRIRPTAVTPLPIAGEPAEAA